MVEEKIQMLIGSMAIQLAQALAKIDEQTKRIAELEAQIQQNSQN